jgi:hypothetical protein
VDCSNELSLRLCKLLVDHWLEDSTPGLQCLSSFLNKETFTDVYKIAVADANADVSPSKAGWLKEENEAFCCEHETLYHSKMNDAT